MEYQTLGSSGLVVSRLGFGTAGFAGVGGSYGAVGSTGLVEAERQIGLCLDAGINLFDTSNSYSGGESERILGQALGARRQHVILSTKASLRVGEAAGPNDLGASRRHLVQACEASLRQLGTDWIDLYQLHAPDALTPIDETLRALEDLVRTGKIRAIGCSNFSGWQLMKGLAVSDRRHLARFASQQIYYSLVCRDAEHELVPLSIDQGVGIVVWGPLASGFLSGKIRRGEAPPGGTRIAAMPEVPKIPDWEHGHDILDVVRAIAEARGVPPSQVALNWLRRKPWVTSLLVGARTEDQLRANLACLDWSLAEEELGRLDAVSAARIVPYPYWVHRYAAPERNPPLTHHASAGRPVAYTRPDPDGR
jgi:aryl-alcohol dehydrogenase-like predicted oxidoreductase